MEEPDLDQVFLYCVFQARKQRLQRLRRKYQLGDTSDHETIADELLKAKEIALPDSDRSRLLRKLMDAEIKALEDLIAGDESQFEGIIDRQAAGALAPASALATHELKPGQAMLELVDQYLEEMAREREWPTKTALRKRGELREFTEIVGDKSVNGYTQEDGVIFKNVQMALPANRQLKPFKGQPLVEIAKLVRELRDRGDKVDLLNTITINDKIGTIGLFFTWARARDSSVVNPVEGLGIKRLKNNRKGKRRHPWTIEELNKMVRAPIYIGCTSEACWKQKRA